MARILVADGGVVVGGTTGMDHGTTTVIGMMATATVCSTTIASIFTEAVTQTSMGEVAAIIFMVAEVSTSTEEVAASMAADAAKQRLPINIQEQRRINPPLLYFAKIART